MIRIQAFINIGGATGMLPITGVTLPFVSYGGSSLLLLMISVVILVNISMLIRLNENSTKAPDKGAPGIARGFLNH
ncbi:FtsW/RodA/SpoVE family cell cycle protein [Metabacillus arenae]|uniref:Probable peptidoglycan glycosyltransferase FtsW n=1 Tax=Metabacillus arenae TaxID=2771434 RepID=A0A926N8H5_9BACI|nr:FtsW/RodA/SpoVE family cell cycle protein [Metabacillus arenae]